MGLKSCWRVGLLVELKKSNEIPLAVLLYIEIIFSHLSIGLNMIFLFSERK